MNGEVKIIYDPRGNIAREELINQGYKVEVLDLTAIHTREGFEKFYGKAITRNVLGKEYQLLLEAPKSEAYLKKD